MIAERYIVGVDGRHVLDGVNRIDALAMALEKVDATSRARCVAIADLRTLEVRACWVRREGAPAGWRVVDVAGWLNGRESDAV